MTKVKIVPPKTYKYNKKAKPALVKLFELNK